jgi:hypothetical protein
VADDASPPMKIHGLVAGAAVLISAAAFGSSGGPLSGTFTHWLNHPAIGYSVNPPRDPVAELNRQLQDGSVRLTSDGPSGYLRSVPSALDVSIDSQVVVFAKDSVQRAIISAANPRALYFNDSVAVGWVRGGFIELAAQDPVQGTVFYALRPSLPGQPQVSRNDGCLGCHYSYSTAGVPEPHLAVRTPLGRLVRHRPERVDATSRQCRHRRYNRLSFPSQRHRRADGVHRAVT